MLLKATISISLILTESPGCTTIVRSAGTPQPNQVFTTSCGPTNLASGQLLATAAAVLMSSGLSECVLLLKHQRFSLQMDRLRMVVYVSFGCKFWQPLIRCIW